jgi:RimJ/RimL family protein N-acetyltransferase
MYGRNNRVKHVVHIGISVLKSHWGIGIGAKLFSIMEAWAKSDGIVRLELTVMTHNERGIALYKKMGFEIEGTKKHLSL